MSDEDDGSFLSLPTAAFSQRPSLAAELSETNALSHQLLIQVTLLCVCVCVWTSKNDYNKPV